MMPGRKFAKGGIFMSLTAASRKALIGAVVMMTACAAFGQEAESFRDFPYDYVEANYINTELDAGGLELVGSLALRPDIRVSASYLDQSFGGGVDRNTLKLGAGYHWELKPKLDMLLDLGYGSSKTKHRNQARIDDNGFVLGARLRGWMTRDVELSGAVLLDDSNGPAGNLVLEFGGQYYLRDGLSVGGRVRTDDDATALFLGARFYFR
jgi:hypothetical protein